MRPTNAVEETIMADALIIDAFRTPRGIGKVGKGALARSIRSSWARRC